MVPRQHYELAAASDRLDVAVVISLDFDLRSEKETNVEIIRSGYISSPNATLQYPEGLPSAANAAGSLMARHVKSKADFINVLININTFASQTRKIIPLCLRNSGLEVVG